MKYFLLDLDLPGELEWGNRKETTYSHVWKKWKALPLYQQKDAKGEEYSILIR